MTFHWNGTGMRWQLVNRGEVIATSHSLDRICAQRDAITDPDARLRVEGEAA